MVLLLITVFSRWVTALWTRTTDFAADWPKYRSILQEATGTVQGNCAAIEGSVTELTTPEGTPKPVVPSNTSSDVHSLLVRGIGSLYALVLEATFVPFLVFFMLAGKREAWHSTLQLFPVARRTQVKETLEDLRDVLRDYLVGMTVVSLVVIACSSIFFLALGLDYPVLTESSPARRKPGARQHRACSGTMFEQAGDDSREHG